MHRLSVVDEANQLLGGATYQDVLTGRASHEAPPAKPGQGGYF